MFKAAILTCEECGAPFERRSMRSKFCLPCQKERKRVRTAQWHKDHPEAVRKHKGLPATVTLTIVCADCGSEYERPNMRGQVPARCDGCQKARSREREIISARRRKLRKYGLTEAEFDQMLSDQGGVCAICRTDNWGLQGPAIDHCHTQGHVRGILCNPCNTALGGFRDNPDLLRSAIEYLGGSHEHTDHLSP